MSSDDRRYLPYIRRVLQDIPPKFDPPTEGYLRHSGLDTSKIRPMGLNECLYPPSPKAIEAIRRNVSMINRYPDAQCPEVGDIISARTGIPLERIVWGDGSEELIKGTIDLTSSPGDHIVLPVPTFWGYRAMVRAAEAELDAVELLGNGKPDVNGMISAVGERTHLVFCVTPGNPSGAFLSSSELERLASEIPDNVVLCVDEAYCDFSAYAGGPDVLAILARRSGPWISLRTFSKAYAMAGMRIGYALCSSVELAQALRKTTCVFNVPILAQFAAIAALNDTAHLEALLAETAKRRAYLDEGLRELGLDPYPSVTNFVSTRVPARGREVTEAMLRHGVQIHAWPDPGYEHHIRITVGDPDDNAACLAALAKILAPAEPAAAHHPGSQS